MGAGVGWDLITLTQPTPVLQAGWVFTSLHKYYMLVMVVLYMNVTSSMGIPTVPVALIHKKKKHVKTINLNAHQFQPF